MDQENIRNLILERFNNLQPEIQDAILDTTYEEKLSQISQKYNLSKEQWSDFEIHTTLVMLGNTHPEDYTDALVESLKISKEQATKITTDVNETILKDILPLLHKNFQEDDEAEEDILSIPLPPNTSKDSDDIPVPTPQKAPKTSQVGIFKDAGIEMVETPMNPIEKKMSGVTVSKKTVKDYTLPKIRSLKPTEDHTKNTDPYHEQI